MSERATTLADQFAAASDELLNVLEAATPAQLAAQCADEHWPVLLTARHVAISYRVVGSWVRKLADGQAVATTRAQIDEGNAQHAAQFPTPDRDEVLTLLRDNAAKTTAMIRGLSDEQLATGAAMGPAEGRTLTADQAIRHVLIQHIKDHLPGIRDAIASA
jgi:hypothetical protein